jgi:pimeloyl-ACP methyl ester carboxylesterase
MTIAMWPPASRMRRTLGVLVVILLLPGSPALAQSVQVTGINAVHRNGQTFVTWKDVEEGERGAKYRYSLYRAPTAIDKETLAHATLVYRGVVNNSAKLFGSDFWPRDRLDPTKPTVPLREGGPPLPLWTGLAVYTTKVDGDAFYAVVATNEDGKALTRVEPGKSATVTAVTERVAPIEPIKVYDSKQRPTYAAQTSISGTKGLPLILGLHGSQAQGGGASDWGDYYTYFGTEAMGYRDGLPGVFSVEERRYETGNVLELKPRDAILHPNGKEPMETYWFGYLSVPQWASHRDRRAYPFTENRLLWLMDWSIKRYGADPDRVYVAGQSMGGWGATTFGLRHPEIFAAIYPTLPRTRQRGLPGLEDGAPRRALMPDGKTDYFERMDMVEFVSQTRTDLPFMGWSIGRRDEFASWKDQVDMARALTASHHAFAFAWNDADHSDQGTRPMELIYKYYDPGKISRKVSYPAFGNSSIDNKPGDGNLQHGDKEGGINLGFAWRDVRDTPDRWTAGLANELAKTDMTVDVTPRRTTEFKPAPGEKFEWTSSAGGSGEVSADRWGLVTVEKVVIRPGQYTTLTISRVGRRVSPRNRRDKARA